MVAIARSSMPPPGSWCNRNQDILERVVCVHFALVHRQSHIVLAAAVTQPARSPRVICVFTALHRPDRLVLSGVQSLKRAVHSAKRAMSSPSQLSALPPLLLRAACLLLLLTPVTLAQLGFSSVTSTVVVVEQGKGLNPVTSAVSCSFACSESPTHAAYTPTCHLTDMPAGHPSWPVHSPDS
jgi:hypothetical protein